MNRACGLGLLGPLLLGVFSCGGGSGSEVRVGVLLPLTGRAAVYGDSVKKGLVLALAQELLRPGGAPVALKLLYRDAATAAEGVHAMSKLLEEDAVPAVLSVTNEVTVACGPLANSKKTVLLSPTASAPEVSTLGPWVYRTGISELDEGIAMAQYCIRTDLDRVSVLHPDDGYGRSLAQIFRRSFEEKGGKIAEMQAFPPGLRDFGPMLANFKKSRPKAVYVPSHSAEMLGFLLQARARNLEVPILSTASFHVREMLDGAGVAAEGVLFSQPAYSPLASEEPVAGFVRAFRERYGETPDLYAAAGYDAGRVLVAAVRVGGNDAEVVQRALDAMDGFEGVLGQTTFDKNGDASRVPQIYTVRDGAIVRIR